MSDDKKTLLTPEPAPKDGTGPAIWDLVTSDLTRRYGRSMNSVRRRIYDLMIKDAEARDEFGQEKYKKRLRNGDGRDSLVDAYQEVLDLTVYLRKEIEGKPRNSKGIGELQPMYEDVLSIWFRLRNLLYRLDGK